MYVYIHMYTIYMFVSQQASLRNMERYNTHTHAHTLVCHSGNLSCCNTCSRAASTVYRGTIDWRTFYRLANLDN